MGGTRISQPGPKGRYDEKGSGTAAAAASVVAHEAAYDHSHIVSPTGALVFMFDGGGVALATGAKAWLRVPWACTLTGWKLTGDVSGAIKIDVWRDTYASFPPTNDDSLCNGHEPEIAASGVKAEDADLADWSSVALAEGDYIRANIDSCSAITLARLDLLYTREAS